MGLAGLVGSGRTTLARAIVGINRKARGTVSTARYHNRPQTPSEALAMGILLLTEDRKREGVVGVRSIAENISLAALGRLSRAARNCPLWPTPQPRDEHDQVGSA